MGHSTGAKPANPFLPYNEDLWVDHLSDTHTLLLNKFNVVAHHLLVVTRSYESQLDRLNASDLQATCQVLKVRLVVAGMTVAAVLAKAAVIASQTTCFSRHLLLKAGDCTITACCKLQSDLG